MDSAGELNFKPHPGRVIACNFPNEEGVEIIATVGEGKFVSPFYDSMVAQVIVHAADRQAAIEKLYAYLDGVQIDGICTNIPLLKRVLTDSVFRDGEYDTDYLPQFFKRTDTASLIEEIEASAGDAAGGIDLDAIRIEDSNELKVLSPATAIFYTTPTPTDPEYVAVGDVISVDDTIGQLEAMKIFTPVTLADFNADFELYDAQKSYEVTRINMTSGQQVNVGDLLLVVKPVDG